MECLFVCDAHRGVVQSLRRSPDGTRLASCGDDGAIMLWDVSVASISERCGVIDRMNASISHGIKA